MTMTKKRKLSGLSGMELTMAYQSLMQLQVSLSEEVEDEGGEDDPAMARKNEVFDQRLAGVMDLMQSQLQGPQSYAFSGMTDEVLTNKLNVRWGNYLKPKDSLNELIESTKYLGKEKFWSSEATYRHLEVLENLVPRKTKSCARAWIDTLFFRASAMVPDSKQMVLEMELPVPSKVILPGTLATISGRTDYTAFVAKPFLAKEILNAPSTFGVLQRQDPYSFFVVEGKLGQLLDHVAQAVAEIYTCARHLKKNIARGALTNGLEWIFLIVYLQEDGNGGTYKQSSLLKLGIHQEINKANPDVIAGMLSHWIQHSFEDITPNDWFEDFND